MNEGNKLVPFARARRRPDRRRVAEFAATARKLQEERAAAEDVVSRLLRERPRSEWIRLAELRNVGAVERLGREVEQRLDREPREALAIAEVATEIADALRAEAYPPVMLAQTRAHAWKDRGQALCYLARHEEALAALDKADAMLEAFGTLAHDLAIVRFVKSSTLQEVNRFEESMRLLAECSKVFNAHGDARRSLLCGIAEGALLHRLKRFRDARHAYMSLLDTARELHDDNAEAYLHHNIGYTSVYLEDFATAASHLDAAVEIFRCLDQELNAARSEVVRGLLFARSGERRRAVVHIGAIRKQFLAHGLVEEAGIVGLEIVEARLGLGEAREAELLAREIIADFTNAKLNTRAISALGYLTEAISRTDVSSSMVGEVREFIVSLRKYPEREFVACA
jgi:tetratricopeptide (TPR) repeat protein